MAFVQGNAVLQITASGTTAPTASNVTVVFNAPVQVIGGTGGFSGVPANSTEPDALVEFVPGNPPQNFIEFGGAFTLFWAWGLLNVTSGSTIDGTITADPALPFAVEFQLIIPPQNNPPTYTLAANAGSGSFSFAFDPGSQQAPIDLGALRARARRR